MNVTFKSVILSGLLLLGVDVSGVAQMQTADQVLLRPGPQNWPMHIDMMTAVPARSLDSKDADAFIRFITSPGEIAVWKVKGTNRY